MTKIYISGPITGYEDQNRWAFKLAAEYLLSVGETPLDPHDVAPHTHDGACPDGYVKPGEQDHDHSSACYLRGDIKALLECDGIFMIRGWEHSIGARLEHEVATRCGLDIYYQYAGWARRA